MKKNFLLICFLVLLPIVANAEAVEIDGICYNLDASTHSAEVTTTPNRYSGNVVIPSTVTYEDISYNVTAISGGAFSGALDLTSISIPQSVTTIIDRNPVEACSSLASITVESGNSVYESQNNCLIETSTHKLIAGCMNSIIPEGVTSIGGWAFRGCTGLATINIPNSVTTIDYMAFFECTGLTSITIPNSVTNIDGNPFEDCSSLASITVESGNSVYESQNNCLIEISSHKLIAGCKNSIIPEGVITIGASAFRGCTGLMSITIPNSVTIINEGAFEDCRGLSSVTIPNSVTSIGYGAFQLSNLSSVIIPSSVKSIGNYAFYIFGMQTVTLENPIPILVSEDFHPFVENQVDLIVPVGSITAYKKSRYWRLFKTIKDTEGNIEDAGATATINVETAGTLSTLIPEAKKNTITTLTLTGSLNGEDLRFIREMAGSDYNANPTAGSLTTIDLSGATIVAGGSYLEIQNEKIGSHKVENGKRFSEDNVFGEYLFAGCDKLLSIILPNNLTAVKRSAFLSLSLTNITLPSSLVSIGDEAFYSCGHLTSIIIPENVTTIGSKAFWGCRRLASITIPASVSSLGAGLFGYCYFLQSITVENENTVYDSHNNCNAVIETISNTLIAGCSRTIIPENVIKIGESAFEGCQYLQSIAIPSSVTTIGSCAFSGCDRLPSIFIPSSVTSIGEYAFVIGYPYTVTVENPTPIAIYENSFYPNQYADLIVPVGSISAYKAANYWKEFKTIKDTEGNTEDAGVVTSATIDVATPGTLSTLISEANKNTITTLTLTGSLNGEDLRFIREMAGSDYHGVPTDGNLTTLDLSGATIVAGGVYVEIQDKKVYYNKEKTSYSSSYSVVDGEKVSEANKIGAYLFAGCQKLQMITLPNNITAIDDFGFWATGLTAITMPNTVTSIGYDAFFCCSNLASVAIPSSVTSIRYSFLGCTNLVSITVDSNNSKYDSRDDCNAIIEKSSNTLIVGCKNTTIPDGVTTIGGGALSNLNLTSITIPGSVTTIDNNAFGGNNLTSITIPSSVTSIGNYAFANNNELQTVTVQNPTPVAIYDETFTNRSNIDLIVPVGSISAYKAANYWKEFKTIKDTEGNTEDASNPNVINVETAGTLSTLLTDPMTITELTITGNLNGTDFRLIRAMAGNDYQGNPTEGKLRYLNLSGATIVDGGEKYLDADDVTINKSNPNYSPSIINVGTIVQNYGEDIDFLTHNNDLSHFLFIGCVKLEELVLPQNITSIGSYVFYYCWNLNTMQIPASVTSVKKYALWFCTGLTSLTIPKTLTSIGDGAFCGLTNATSITVEGDNPNYDSRENCNAIIETSANKLLAGCKNTLIPNGITRIENNALRNLDITSITIPSSVTSIGSQAFANNELETVTVQNPTPITILESTFSNRSNIDLVVPVGSISAYKAANYWKEFKTIKDTAGNSEDASDPSGIDVTDISQLENAIYIEPTEGRVSEVVDLPVKLKNTMSPVGCSFKLTLPEGFTLQKDVDGDVIYDLGERARKMSLTFHGDNNTYDFAMTPSSGTATISGNDGVVVTFKVMIPETATEGAHALRLTNNLIQRMVDETIKDFAQPDITTVINVSNYVTGDANGDGVVTPSDAIMILYYYFNVSLNGFNVKAADLNGDGNITPADAIAALYLYFNAGSANTRSMHVDDELDPE